MNLFKSAAAPGYFFEDFFHACCPDKGCGVGVPRGKKVCDGLLQILHAAEDAASHSLLVEFGKPAFDQVEPTGTGWNEVQDEAWMPGQPAPDTFVAVGPIVVEDQVQGYGIGKLLVKAAQKLKELLMAVARITLANDTPFDHLERRKQGRRAMALIVMSKGAAAPGFEGQSRLGAIQRLNLALFIHAEHDRILRRSEINTHYIGELFQKLGITGKFEAFGEMRLELMLLPDAMNGVFAHALDAGQ